MFTITVAGWKGDQLLHVTTDDVLEMVELMAHWINHEGVSDVTVLKDRS